ncbi:hypothetical protein [Embleya sp. NPDC005575]
MWVIRAWINDERRLRRVVVGDDCMFDPRIETIVDRIRIRSGEPR